MWDLYWTREAKDISMEFDMGGGGVTKLYYSFDQYRITITDSLNENYIHFCVNL
jgi:hypothetical protein